MLSRKIAKCLHTTNEVHQKKDARRNLRVACLEVDRKDNAKRDKGGDENVNDDILLEPAHNITGYSHVEQEMG